MAGGLNLYGYANGDPVNFSDPFGLNPCVPITPACVRQAAAVVNRAIDQITGGIANALGELTGLFGGYEALFGRDAVTGEELSAGRRVFEAGMLLVGARSVIRGTLSGLGLSDDLANGVRRALRSGRGDYGVELLDDGGAVVHRWVRGGDGSSSAIYSYRLNERGETVGILQRGFDEFGNLTEFDVKH